jgi:FkbM family methyltransferase
VVVIRAAVVNILRFLAAIDGVDSIRCIVDQASRREVKRIIRIRGIPVHVRSGSPDVRVAISSLYSGEYENIVCSDPAVIMDAGANIGTSSIYFARKYPGAKVLAIEPEADNHALLVENTRVYNNVVPIRAAVWSSPGQRVLQDRHTGPWGYTIADTANPAEPTDQQIDCVTIPSLMDEYDVDRIDLLKMDIEGGEKELLEHSAQWIDRVDVLAVELHDRICPGCSDAFAAATRRFRRSEVHGEKVIAYRH